MLRSGAELESKLRIGYGSAVMPAIAGRLCVVGGVFGVPHPPRTPSSLDRGERAMFALVRPYGGQSLPATRIAA